MERRDAVTCVLFCPLRQNSAVILGARDELSISYNEFLRSFIAVHFRGIESVIVSQTAPQPEGPWQVLDELAVPPPADNVLTHFTAVEHPQLSTSAVASL